MRKTYPPHVIDAALRVTVNMLLQGKVISWQGSRMYRTREGICLDGNIIGDPLEAVALWFNLYSPADPYRGNWFKKPL